MISSQRKRYSYFEGGRKVMGKKPLIGKWLAVGIILLFVE
jgi:hypothetical protein